DSVALNDAAAIVAPTGGGAFVGFAAEKFHPEVLLETGLPDRFSVHQAQAAEFAVTGLHVEALAVENGCRPRPDAPFVLETLGVVGLPQFLAGGSVHHV